MIHRQQNSHDLLHMRRKLVEAECETSLRLQLHLHLLHLLKDASLSQHCPYRKFCSIELEIPGIQEFVEWPPIRAGMHQSEEIQQVQKRQS
ncbi:hypothetical protein D3C80_1487810 [compost metagenome]